MPNAQDIQWFKTNFQARVERALAGTPFGIDLIAALACQETGEIWPLLRRKGLPEAGILALCVGDTLDADKGRRAFPKTKAELLAAPRGAAMFALARQALLDMAQHISAYGPAAAKAHKFCRGFGMFQRDLQFFTADPDYFLEKRYEHFEHTLAACVDELKRGLRRLKLQDRTSLTELEQAHVAIAYNTGRFVPSKGLRQGHFNGRKFYGEGIFDFIRLSQTVAIAPSAPALPESQVGQAIVAAPTAVSASGPFFKVDTRSTTLRLRSAPLISTPATANVIGELPDGHRVRGIGGMALGGFLEVQTSLNGALLQGFAARKFLLADPDASPIPAVQPLAPAVGTGIQAVSMPRKPNTITRRRDPANAHSLNEPSQPHRQGQNADELRLALSQIIDWLAVDKPSNARYQSRDGLTFCNIYAHDYCHLASVYLPRVWWTNRALLALAKGTVVAPLIGDTIEEVRANGLFRWLRDFGPAFGWRQTGTLSKLQQEANQGAVCLIVARRKEDGRSGHVVMVVPETPSQVAKRNALGEVINPVQSQAGRQNFRRAMGPSNWWKGAQFADSAFWLHA